MERFVMIKPVVRLVSVFSFARSVRAIVVLSLILLTPPVSGVELEIPGFHVKNTWSFLPSRIPPALSGLLFSPAGDILYVVGASARGT